MYDSLQSNGNSTTTTSDENGVPICSMYCTLSSPISSDDPYATYNYFLVVIVLPIIACFGAFGTIASVFIFTRRQMLNSLNCYLAALALSDLFLVLTSIFVFTFEACRHFNDLIRQVYLATIIFAFPLTTIAQTCSVYLTVAAAVDCFISVWCDHWRRKLCSIKLAFPTTLLIILLCVIYNVPHFFEVSVVTCYSTLNNYTIVEVCPTDFRTDPDYYLIYYMCMYTIVMTAGPLIILIFLNGAIIYKVARRKRLAKQLQHLPGVPDSLDTSEDTMALVMVVVLFIVCNTLGLIVNFLETFGNLGKLMNYLVDSSNLLVIINSSANFVIYCIFGKRFREMSGLYVQRFSSSLNQRRVAIIHRITSASSHCPSVTNRNEVSSSPNTTHVVRFHDNNNDGDVDDENEMVEMLSFSAQNRDFISIMKTPNGTIIGNNACTTTTTTTADNNISLDLISDNNQHHNCNANNSPSKVQLKRLESSDFNGSKLENDVDRLRITNWIQFDGISISL